MTSRHISQRDLLILPRNLDGLRLGAYIYCEVLAKQLLACYQQACFLLDYTADVVSVRPETVRVI